MRARTWIFLTFSPNVGLLLQAPSRDIPVCLSLGLVSETMTVSQTFLVLDDLDSFEEC